MEVEIRWKCPVCGHTSKETRLVTVNFPLHPTCAKCSGFMVMTNQNVYTAYQNQLFDTRYENNC